MFGWFIGRKVWKNVSKDIRRVRTTQPLEIQKAMARQLANLIVSVESTGKSGGISSAIRAAEKMLKQATKDRRDAVSTTEPYSAAWLRAAIAENWAIARVTSLRGKISMKAFRRVDAAVSGFLLETLGPKEIASIIQKD
jgi:hypothetical protein